MRKLRIISIGEFSGLSSGIAKIQLELLSRFHATNKYEIAELATGISPIDRRIQHIPWKVCPVMPGPNDKQRQEIFSSHPIHSSGRYLFETIACQFKPDVVICSTDPWIQLFWLIDNPLRRMYKIAYHAPVDGYPQKNTWITWQDQADKLFTYSKWGTTVLQEALPHRNDIEPSYLCADSEIFKPMDKSAIRKSLGLLDDSIIFGMCARNQLRKDFDGLMQTFAKYLNKVSDDIAKRSFLYIHTTYPDSDRSWELHSMLHEHGLSSKVLFTYRCLNCSTFYPAFFQDTKSICRKCGKYALQMSGSHNPVSPQELALIYNIFDIYAHLIFCGGFELPILEAASCGIPTIYSDYSGTEDFKTSLDAIPVPIKAFRREIETGRYWGISDYEQACDTLVKFGSMPKQILRSMGAKLHQNAIKNYNWDNSANLWMKYFDQLKIEDWQSTWFSQPRVYNGNLSMPPNHESMKPRDFVNWCLINTGFTDMIDSPLAIQHSHFLNTGFIIGSNQPFGKKNVIDFWAERARNYSFWERERLKFS